jgi:hypothetical protein
MRDWLNQNSAAVTVAALAVILIGLAVIIRSGMRTDHEASPNSSYAWYVDSVDGKLFAAENKAPPIKSADGHDAWRVRLYSCGNCTAQERFIGVYERFPAAVHAHADRDLARNPDFAEHLEISRDAKTWYPAGSDQAARIMLQVLKRCPGKRPINCVPDKPDTADD